MTINDKRKTTSEVLFLTLSHGDVFEWEGHFYCRLNEEVMSSNAVDLYSFGLHTFGREDRVIPVCATLEIENIRREK